MAVARSDFFEPAMNEQMQARRVMELDLRKALTAGEFELYYQPVVNLESNEITGFEALLRWNHPAEWAYPTLDLHSAGGRDRLHLAAWRMGDPAGLPCRRAMAGASRHRRQYFGCAVPRRRA